VPVFFTFLADKFEMMFKIIRLVLAKSTVKTRILFSINLILGISFLENPRLFENSDGSTSLLVSDSYVLV
jgi:hypothetical protein